MAIPPITIGAIRMYLAWRVIIPRCVGIDMLDFFYFNFAGIPSLISTKKVLLHLPKIRLANL